MRVPRIIAALTLAGLGGCVLFTDLDDLSGGAAPLDGGTDAIAAGDAQLVTDVVSPDGGVEAGPTYAAEVTADGPVAYLRLGELAGNVAKDERETYDGLHEGTVFPGRPGLLAGDPDRALRLEGTGWVTLPDIKGLFVGQSPFTIEAWIAADGFVGTQWIVGRENVNPPRYGVSLLFDDRGVGLERWQAGGASRVSGGAPRVGMPSHVVATFDGVKAQVWVDGVAGSAGSSGTNVQNNDRAITIGSQSSHLNGFLRGVVDEVALYDFALSPARIEAHYRAGAR